MNGRIYDPGVGRFLSADLLVQFPGDLQSYNRYSYVQNNPLTYNDPSGFMLFFAGGDMPLLRQAAPEVPKFLGGVAVGWGQGNGLIQGPVHSGGNRAVDLGMVVGNSVATVQGLVEVGGGITMSGGGGTVSVGSGGLLAPIGVPVASLGTAITMHGGAVTVNSVGHMKENLRNMMESRVEEAKPTTGSDGGRVKPNEAPNKPIDSSRPQHGTPEHDATAFNEAKQMESTPGNTDARFNQKLTDTNGNKISNLQPDAQVTRQTPLGPVKDITEVRSPSQSPSFMDKKIETYKNILGDQAGVVKWIEAQEKARRVVPLK